MSHNLITKAICVHLLQQYNLSAYVHELHNTLIIWELPVATEQKSLKYIKIH